jgi:hypothetical protein
MQECMRCGDKDLLIEYSTFRDGTPFFLCYIHTPLDRLEKEIEHWLKDTHLLAE